MSILSQSHFKKQFYENFYEKIEIRYIFKIIQRKNKNIFRNFKEKK